MAKNSVRDFDATAANNTDIQSVDIAENCAPSGINNAIRELMADIKNVSTGTIALESPSADSLTVTGDLTVDTNTLYVDSTNSRVGVSNTTPSSFFSDANQLVVGSGSGSQGITIYSGTSENAQIFFADGTSGNAAYRGIVRYIHSSDAMAFYTSGANERMRIDDSGNVGIGTSSPVSTSKLDVRGRIQVGNSDDVSMASDARGHIRIQGNGYGGAITCDATGMHVYHNASGKSLVFGTNDTERARIDTNGVLLVGTTDDSPYNNSAGSSADNGLVVSGGRLWVARYSGTPLDLNRTSDDGNIINLRKDGSVVGSIRSVSGIYISLDSTGGTGFLGVNGTNYYAWDTIRFYPVSDNARDLGLLSKRFDDIFATNGTIQTSDQNEKQQIASLTDAEITAAKAISKLFKTFKWNDKVEAKGDAARRHAGVIAQEVQQAMTDAGLNAADYAFFCSDTWWESDGETYETQSEAPEGATERTRLGIRYPELLAFVGAATEQRLADIETRLTTLENA